MPKLPKRISTALINALGAGVVPRVGLEHLAVGREKELATVLQDLDTIASGGAGFRFVVGRYGAGKSFTLQLIRSVAMERGFVVADADITPERRIASSNGASVATYRELMHNLSTKSRPDGGALATILERWIAAIQQQVAEETGKKPNDEGFDQHVFDQQVEDRIREVTQDVSDLVNGFDFATVIIAYWSGYRTNNEAKKEAALRWLRGEFSTKTEARAALGVRAIIDDDTWYDYIKLLARFVADIDYKGLIIILDEVIHLFKIPTTVSRQNNYDKLLAMFNDAMQGKVKYLGTLIGGTPQFLEDPRRGLYSDPAWQRRTAQSRFTTQAGLGATNAGWNDASAPVIYLEPLQDEHVIELLRRLSDIHKAHHEYNKALTQQDLQMFVEALRDRAGAKTFLTPGDIVRDFMSVLNVLHQNPDLTMNELLKSQTFQTAKPATKVPQVDADSEFAEFTL